MADDEREVLARPFGAVSRQEMLAAYFAGAEQVTTQTAWQHVYRLLLWIDRTTGLAHCYESDKAQPGRPWYQRSLAFHAWVAVELRTSPGDLGAEIDWLFRTGTERLARAVALQETARAAAATRQREGYDGFPVPGKDTELEALILDEMGAWLSTPPPADVLLSMTRRVRAYFGQENKRKNLVGEGFEDVLAALIARLCSAPAATVFARPLLHDIPGFRSPPRGEKPRRVDLAVVTANGRRTLVSAKWSVRADREEQFGVDFETYARLEEAGQDFDFVLITNEFDAARLVAACDRRRPGANLFSAVVHVNPQGPLAAYGNEVRRSAARLPDLIESGRIISLEEWLGQLTS